MHTHAHKYVHTEQAKPESVPGGPSTRDRAGVCPSCFLPKHQARQQQAGENQHTESLGEGEWGEVGVCEWDSLRRQEQQVRR